MEGGIFANRTEAYMKVLDGDRRRAHVQPTHTNMHAPNVLIRKKGNLSLGGGKAHAFLVFYAPKPVIKSLANEYNHTK